MAESSVSMRPRLAVRDLGRIDFKQAWDYQEDLLKKTIQARERGAPSSAGSLLFCEHPPVYTLGKSGREQHLLAGHDELERQGIAFYRINRGGDITYHGPGQWVVYPVIDLDLFFHDVHRYLRNLEEVVIRALAEYGIRGGRIDGVTGVWVQGAAVPGKICAFGVRCSRWVTMHGLALNVNTDLRAFDRIVPCGIADKAVTSMEREMGRPADMGEVKEALIRHFMDVFEAMPAEG